MEITHGDMMSVIGIDLGTSFIKGAILNLEAFQLEHIQRLPFPNRLKLANPLLSEFDPEEVTSAVRTLIDNLVRIAPDCEGIVICSQMHGMVLINRQREAVSNCISWMDHRGLMPHPSGSGSYLDVLMRRTNEVQRKQLGNELGLERPACFLFWLSEQGQLEPDIAASSIPDYVVSTLCDCDPGIEATNASASGLFNLESGVWHQDVLDALGLTNLRLPTIRQQGAVVGQVKIGSRLLPCFTPVGDLQCALLGSLISHEELSLNISTGAQVSRLTSQLELGDHQTRPFFGGQFINTFSDAPGGRALNVLVDLVTEFAASQPSSRSVADPWAFVAAAVKETLDTDLEVDPSFFESAPEIGGAIRNIRGENLTVGHLFRASFNGMASIYHAYACRLWPEPGWKNIVFSGGLAFKLRVLREVIQAKFGTEYRLCPFAEDTLFGLLLLARAFSGRDASIQETTNMIRSARPESLVYEGQTPG